MRVTDCVLCVCIRVFVLAMFVDVLIRGTRRRREIWSDRWMFKELASSNAKLDMSIFKNKLHLIALTVHNK
jgi:hypothetical protein